VNFLEQLVGEWYQYKGHFVRTNIRFAKRSKGGWAGEIDILAYLPQRGNVSHIETSMDAESWARRKKVFQKKFDVPWKVYEDLVPAGFESLERIVVVGSAREQDPSFLGHGIHVYSVPTMVRLISLEIGEKHPMKEAVAAIPLFGARRLPGAVCHVPAPASTVARRRPHSA
jgi:hypothetical protein